MLQHGSTQYFREHYSRVKFEHEDNVVKIGEILREIEHKQPLLIQGYKTRMATSRMLLKQRELVEHMLHEGTLIDLDAAPIISDINDKLRDLYLEPLYEAIPCTKAYRRTQAQLNSMPLMRSNTTGRRHRLASMLDHAPLYIHWPPHHLPRLESHTCAS